MKTFALLLVFTMAACSPKPPESSRTIEGTTAERVAVISTCRSKTAPLPSPLLDAHFIEEQAGNGRFGPSDFKAFYALTVAPANLPAWKAALSEPETWNHFANDVDIRRAVPKKAQPWWVSGADLSALAFYSPQSLTGRLTGRLNGWVGVAPDGRIFVFSFTM